MCTFFQNFCIFEVVTDAQPEIFQGWVGFVKLGHFDKYFVKNSRKKGPTGKILKFFLLDTLKTTFWIVNLTWRWTKSEPVSLKSGHFSWFSKRAEEASEPPAPPPLPLVACLYDNFWPSGCSINSVFQWQYTFVRFMAWLGLSIFPLNYQNAYAYANVSTCRKFMDIKVGKIMT